MVEGCVLGLFSLSLFSGLAVVLAGRDLDP